MRTQDISWRSRASKGGRLFAALTAALMSGACAQLGGATGELGLPSLTAENQPEPEKHDLQSATIYWGKRFIERPGDPNAALAYARNLKATGDMQRAAAVLRQAATNNPQHRGIASEYGWLSLELGNVKLAEKLLEQAEDPAKPDWKVVSARGTVQAKMGNFDAAIALFKRAQQLAPNEPTVMNNLAMAYTAQGQLKEAEALLQKVAHNPNATPRMRQNLALVLGLQGRFTEAKAVSAQDVDREEAYRRVEKIKEMVKTQESPLVQKAAVKR